VVASKKSGKTKASRKPVKLAAKAKKQTVLRKKSATKSVKPTVKPTRAPAKKPTKLTVAKKAKTRQAEKAKSPKPAVPKKPKLELITPEPKGETGKTEAAQSSPTPAETPTVPGGGV